MSNAPRIRMLDDHAWMTVSGDTRLCKAHHIKDRCYKKKPTEPKLSCICKKPSHHEDDCSMASCECYGHKQEID